MGRKELNNSYMKLPHNWRSSVSSAPSWGWTGECGNLQRLCSPQLCPHDGGWGPGGAEMEEHFCSNYISSCYIKMLKARCNLYLYQMDVLYPGRSLLPGAYNSHTALMSRRFHRPGYFWISNGLLHDPGYKLDLMSKSFGGVIP